MKNKHLESTKGFTLVETMIVAVIISILLAIAIPVYKNISASAKTNVCLANCRQIETHYTAYLLSTDLKHSDTIFTRFMHENYTDTCPSGGAISFEGGRIRCSIHKTGDSRSPEPTDEPVPYL
jgi:prepilin-type N-terminal cleavage/methylation domain-containing protein